MDTCEEVERHIAHTGRTGWLHLTTDDKCSSVPKLWDFSRAEMFAWSRSVALSALEKKSMGAALRRLLYLGAASFNGQKRLLSLKHDLTTSHYQLKALSDPSISRYQNRAGPWWEMAMMSSLLHSQQPPMKCGVYAMMLKQTIT